VVEPGTGQDISSILKILAQTRTPFVVKGGGHATNPGFSSTLGVQISMSQFSQVTYNVSSQTATIGAGLTWDQVYAALEPLGVCVVAGGVSGVGVAGFTLGGSVRACVAYWSPDYRNRDFIFRCFLWSETAYELGYYYDIAGVLSQP